MTAQTKQTKQGAEKINVDVRGAGDEPGYATIAQSQQAFEEIRQGLQGLQAQLAHFAARPAAPSAWAAELARAPGLPPAPAAVPTAAWNAPAAAYAPWAMSQQPAAAPESAQARAWHADAQGTYYPQAQAAYASPHAQAAAGPQPAYAAANPRAVAPPAVWNASPAFDPRTGAPSAALLHAAPPNAFFDPTRAYVPTGAPPHAASGAGASMAHPPAAAPGPQAWAASPAGATPAMAAEGELPYLRGGSGSASAGEPRLTQDLKAAQPRLRAPGIDLVDEGSRYSIRCELPGVRQEDLEIVCFDRSLLVKARSEPDLAEGTVLMGEPGPATYRRHIPLPANVQPKECQAELRDGILTVRLAKQAPSDGPRRLDVAYR